jgi:REP element-mobilizing transposase RayT
MDSDTRFLQDLFKRFVPAVISNTGLKKSKRPVFKGWLDVTEEQSAELARHVNYQDGPFMFITGKKTKYIAVDLDRREESRDDHEDKTDGVEYWNNNFEESDHMNTLIIKTPSGGVHLVYRYEEGITSGQLEKDVLIDILSDGKAMCFGPGYEILNRAMPTSAPPKLVQIIINNNNYGSQIINNNSTTLPLKAKVSDSYSTDYSSDINAAAGSDVNWDVIHKDNAVIMIPHTAVCAVDCSHVHSEQKHSRFIVTRSSVVAKCFSHDGQRTVTGDVSRRLREIFFPGSSFENFMHSMMDLCDGESFVRLDGFVWKARSDTPWIHDRLVSYEEFINTHFRSNHVFMRNPKKFADVIKYMETVDHESFPFLKKNADYMGFNNCFINIVTHEVFTSGNAAPRHSMSGNFSWENVDTPMFDSLVQYQLGSGDIYAYFMAFIGRLFYRVKRFDNFNIVPLIKGDTGTGKSTVLTVINKMFAPGAVGVLNSNNELTFGLEGKYEKELLIAHEIGDKFTVRLSSDLFKQMVCGEDISIPRKNKSSINVTWGVPMFLCSNVHLSYADNQGSISRRLAIFKFDKYVARKDITLEARIIESELPAIVAKCLMAYRSMLQCIGNRSFWDVCPEYFHENTREMSEQTDHIYMFLTLPPGDNVYGDKDVYFMKQEGAMMLLQDFKNKFMNYMRFRHPGVKYRWTSDYSSFHKLGYRVVHQHVCKGCGSHAEAGCCNKYSAANRSKKYIIENLVCVDG